MYLADGNKKEVYAITSLFYFLQQYYSIKVTYMVNICYNTSIPAPEMRGSSVTSASHLRAATIYIYIYIYLFIYLYLYIYFTVLIMLQNTMFVCCPVIQ